MLPAAVIPCLRPRHRLPDLVLQRQQDHLPSPDIRRIRGRQRPGPGKDNSPARRAVHAPGHARGPTKDTPAHRDGTHRDVRGLSSLPGPDTPAGAGDEPPAHALRVRHDRDGPGDL